MRLTRALLLTVAALTVPASVVGQTPPSSPSPALQTPARDAIVSKIGTAVIRGRVLAAGTGVPLVRAVVTLTTSLQPLSTPTDTQGRFEFTGLAAGRYHLAASKAGYVTLKFGQRRADEAARSIDLKDGAVEERIDIPLLRGAVITGRVIGVDGQPAVGVAVEASRLAYGVPRMPAHLRDSDPLRVAFAHGGRRQLVNVATSSTNDLGEYRFHGLPAGAYYISTIRWTNAGGDAFGYAPVYHPSTNNPAQAEPVTVQSGQERGSVDLQVLPVRLARVSGTALDSHGHPLQIGLITLGWNQVAAGFTPQARPDGTFTLYDVPPGPYALQASGRTETGEREIARVFVEVGAEEISGLVATVPPPSVVRGRIQFEDAPAPRYSGSSVQLIAQQVAPRTALDNYRDVSVKNDWSFESSNLWGPRLFRFTTLPDGWMLKSILLNNQDITDTAVDFQKGQDVDGIQIRLTNRATEVRGQVLDDRDKPLTEYTVVFFPPDAGRWNEGSRFIASARAKSDGRYSVGRLPAGDYLAVALDSLEEGQEQDPDFLLTLRSRGTKITVLEGDITTLDLRLSRGAR